MGPGRVTPVTPAAAGPAPYSLLCVDSTPEPGQAQPVRPAQPACPARGPARTLPVPGAPTLCCSCSA